MYYLRKLGCCFPTATPASVQHEPLLPPIQPLRHLGNRVAQLPSTQTAKVDFGKIVENFREVESQLSSLYNKKFQTCLRLDGTIFSIQMPNSLGNIAQNIQAHTRSKNQYYEKNIISIILHLICSEEFSTLMDEYLIHSHNFSNPFSKINFLQLNVDQTTKSDEFKFDRVKKIWGSDDIKLEITRKVENPRHNVYAQVILTAQIALSGNVTVENFDIRYNILS